MLTPLHRLELVTAWHLKVFRGEIPIEAAAQAAADLQADVDAGVWRSPGVEWAAVFVVGEGLSRRHAASTGTRTLDVLHVASALELGAKDFVTGDVRQAALAAAAGLKVTRL